MPLLLETLVAAEYQTDPMAELLGLNRHFEAAKVVKHLSCMTILVDLLAELGGSHYLRELLLVAKGVELEACVLTANVHDLSTPPTDDIRVHVGVVREGQHLNTVANLVGHMLSIRVLYLCADVHTVHCHLAFAATMFGVKKPYIDLKGAVTTTLKCFWSFPCGRMSTMSQSTQALTPSCV